MSSKHLRLTEVEGGQVLVEDLDSSNGTFIDGVRIVKKIVGRDCIVQMGASYRFKVCDALRVQKSATPPPTADAQGGGTAYSISGLEAVWASYDRSVKALNERNRKIGLMSRVSPVFTLGSGAIAGVARGNGWGESVFVITSALTVIGLLIMLYSIWQAKSFDYAKEKEVLDDKFIEEYVCPNEKCRHFLGFQKFSIMRQNKNCPYCRCKFTLG